MTDFLVSYDLRKTKDYPELWQAFEEVGGFKVLNSAYLVSLNSPISAASVLEHFRAFVDDDDGLFVVEFSEKPAAYRCKKGTGQWIKDRYY